MAFIKCSGCGKTMSDRAPKCPNCGLKVGSNPSVRDDATKQEDLAVSTSGKGLKDRLGGRKVIAGVFVAVVMTIGVFAVARYKSHVQLKGQVFVVTKGSENIRLGLVTVSIYGEKDMQNFVSSMMPVAFSAFNGLSHARDRVIEEINSSVTRLADIIDRRFLEALKIHDRVVLSNYRAYREYGVKEKLDELEEIEKKIETWNYAEYVLSQISIKPIAQAITDADGRYSVELPSSEPIAIAARGNRQLLKDVEKYTWLLWVSPKDYSKKELLLSNQNMSTAKIAEQVVKWDQ